MNSAQKTSVILFYIFSVRSYIFGCIANDAITNNQAHSTVKLGNKCRYVDKEN